MKKLVLLLSLVIIAACNSGKEKPTAFPKEALADTFLTLDSTKISFQEVLNKYKGKKIMLEVCASWCKECILGLPHVNKLKEKNLDAVFVFLSIDKTVPQWKRGIERFDIKGEHYFMPESLKSSFAKSLGVKDIPYYMVINELGIPVLNHASEPTDPRIAEALNE